MHMQYCKGQGKTKKFSKCDKSIITYTCNKQNEIIKQCSSPYRRIMLVVLNKDFLQLVGFLVDSSLGNAFQMVDILTS